MVADHEGVLADDLEAVARVEALRPMVFAPHADPEGAWPVAFEPLQRGAQQEDSAAAALVSAQNVEALDLAVARCDVGVGQVCGAGGHIADESVGERGRGFLPGIGGAGVLAWDMNGGGGGGSEIAGRAGGLVR